MSHNPSLRFQWTNVSSSRRVIRTSSHDIMEYYLKINTNTHRGNGRVTWPIFGFTRLTAPKVEHFFACFVFFSSLVLGIISSKVMTPSIQQRRVEANSCCHDERRESWTTLFLRESADLCHRGTHINKNIVGRIALLVVTSELNYLISDIGMYVPKPHCYYIMF